MWCDLFVNVFQFLAETLLSDYLAKSGTGSQQCAHRHSFRKFNICPAKDLFSGVYYKSSIAYHQFDIRQLELFARQCSVAEGRGFKIGMRWEDCLERKSNKKNSHRIRSLGGYP